MKLHFDNNSLGNSGQDYWEYFLRRFLASMIDFLILVLPCFLANAILPGIGAVLIVFLYSPVLESSEIQATVGKYVLGMRVQSVGGRRISFRAAALRCLVKVASSMVFFIGHVFAFFTERRQAVHDLAAGSVVVRVKSDRIERSVIEAWLKQIRGLFRAVQNYDGFAEGGGGEGSAGGGVVGARSESEAGRSSVEELERLQSLRERGVLTEEEFQDEKRRILKRGKKG